MFLLPLALSLYPLAWNLDLFRAFLSGLGWVCLAAGFLSVPKGCSVYIPRKKIRRKRIQPLLRTMCFSEQLRGRVGSCCLAAGWRQGATPFGVPAKAGFGFTLPRRLVAGNGVCPCAGSCPCPCFRILLLRARGKRFSWERAKDGCLLSLLQVHVLRPGFAMCWEPFPKLFPTFLCALGTAQSPGLSAYDLEMEGVSSRRGMQGQELFAGMLCTQAQCILGCLRSGLGVSSVE